MAARVWKSGSDIRIVMSVRSRGKCGDQLQMRIAQRFRTLHPDLLPGKLSMILIGQYDSPFVRRVGIALTLYEMPFEHRPWSTFGDADKIRPYSPLTRVPTLVLDNGEVLIESHSILDYLDSLVPPAKEMFPSTEPARHQALKIAALATGMGEKAVSLFYEKRFHKEVSKLWIERCQSQISRQMINLC